MALIGSVRKVGACRQTDRNLGERSRRWQGQRRRRRTGTGRLLPASKHYLFYLTYYNPFGPGQGKKDKAYSINK